MNKIKLFKNLVLLLAFFLSASSCKTWSNQPALIRITDLSGKPVNVDIRTPEGNIPILEEIEKNPNAYQDPTQIPKTAPVILSEDELQDNPVNKYVRDDKVATKMPAQNQAEKIANKRPNTQSGELQILEAQSRESQILEAQAQTTRQELMNQENLKQEQIAKEKTTSTKSTTAEIAAAPIAEKPQNTAPEKIFVFKPTKEGLQLPSQTKSTSKSGEIYVQLGLFSQADNAKKALDSSQNIASGEVKEENVGGKNSYRALLGPFSSNSQAQEIIRQLSKSGKDSFIYKK